MSLPREKTIEKLETYTASSFPILSVYLPLNDTSKSLQEQFHALLLHLLDKRQRQEMAQNIAYIDGYLSQAKPQQTHGTLVLFSGGNKVWEVIHWEEPLPQIISLDHTPLLAPLYEAMQDEQRYLVILADRQKAKLYTLMRGYIEHEEEVYDNHVPQNVKTRGASEPYKSMDNHIKDHVEKNLKSLTRRLQAFAKKSPVSGVLIGGHQTFLHDIRNHLPNFLQNKVLGSFIADLQENKNAILEKSNTIIASAMKQNHTHQSLYLTRM